MKGAFMLPMLNHSLCARSAVYLFVQFFQYFSGPPDYAYKLKSIALHYNNYKSLMEHWSKIVRLAIMEVSYEDLIDN